jgi:quinone-modifying oxidoreductase subunit QmoC
MSDACLLKPDREFVDRVVGSGGEKLKQCYQCATCSVICELAPDHRPFPRKEMIWAQWGLKDRLVADPDVWLCYQCGDCTAHCPRGARPGDVLAAVRQETVEHYAVPKLLGQWAGQVKYLPVMAAIAVVLLLSALAVRDPLVKFEPLQPILSVMNHHGFYAALYPHWLLIGFFTFFGGLGLLAGMVGVVRFWRAMKAADVAAGRYQPALAVVPSLVKVLGSIFTHDKFGKCGANASRRWAHLGAFYGFVALFAVSVWAVIALYVINPLVPGTENDLHYPFALWNPWKLLANVGAVILIAGSAKAIVDRLHRKDDGGAGTSFDWIFVWLILGVGATGLLTEILRWIAEPAGEAAGKVTFGTLCYVAYTVYFVHLVLVFQLLVYLPFSKFAHILYRTAALVYAEHSGRTREAVRPAPAETAGQT